jgi:hypothetical protein
MALAYTYMARSAIACGVTLNGTVTFSVRVNGQVIDLSSDADIFERLVCLSKVTEEIEIETLDVAAAIVVGTAGATTLVGAKHTGGVTLSGTLTCTAAAGVVTAVEQTINQDGRPVLRVTIKVKSSNGSTSGIGWASA